MNPRGPESSALPPSFGEGFRTRDARAAGVSARRLRSSDLEAPYSGLRAIEEFRTLEDRCRLLIKRMPTNAFFSHVTAASLYGMPLPSLLQRSTRLDISTPMPHRAPHARGIIGHQLTIQPYDVTTHKGLPITTAARTWCELGSVLSLLDLVAAGDFLLKRDAPLASITQLVDTVNARVSPRGQQAVLNALPLLHDRAESPRESALRVLLGLAALPQPSVNHKFFDRAGQFIARSDLYFPSLNLAIEYQGDYHRTDKNQWRRDMSRRAALEAEGVRVMEVNSDDLRSPANLAERIRKRAALPY